MGNPKRLLSRRPTELLGAIPQSPAKLPIGLFKLFSPRRQPSLLLALFHLLLLPVPYQRRTGLSLSAMDESRTRNSDTGPAFKVEVRRMQTLIEGAFWVV